MKCIVCRIEVSRSADAAVQFSCWETELGTLTREPTGKAAHVACLNGDRYDENQMTIAEAITEEE